MRIATVLTAFNRREKTLACLDALQRQQIGSDSVIEIFLTDDASPDGTGSAVRTAFPHVTVLNGTGNLFWDGGMRLAFGEALRHDFDAYLWLNDDTDLFPGSLLKLLQTAFELRARGEAKSIVVGATCDSSTGALTYSGAVRSSRYHPLKFRHVIPRDTPQRCDTFNGNCVLISREVAAAVGNISGDFTQSMGDFDYGLRAGQLGCSIWLASGFIGTCSTNPARGSWQDVSLGLRERWRSIRNPKGLPPAEYFKFASRHAGPLWPLYWAMPYMRLLITAMLSRSLGTTIVHTAKNDGDAKIENA